MRPADTSSARNGRTLDHLAFDMQTARSSSSTVVLAPSGPDVDRARAWLREAAQLLR